MPAGAGHRGGPVGGVFTQMARAAMGRRHWQGQKQGGQSTVGRGWWLQPGRQRGGDVMWPGSGYVFNIETTGFAGA